MFKETRTIFLIFAAGFVIACSDEKLPDIQLPIVEPTHSPKPHLDEIDISKMGPLGPKRMQSDMTDAEGNRNRVLEVLIANGTDSIPFLINQLDDETKIERRIIPFFYQQSVGDVALVILSQLFSDETEMQSTVPGFWWDDFLERGGDRSLMGEEVLRRYIQKHGRKKIKQRWQQMWDRNKDRIFWDEKCYCFKLRTER